jgi:hypothetical protein
VPPAENGDTIRTGLLGQSAASDKVTVAARIAAAPVAVLRKKNISAPT